MFIHNRPLPNPYDYPSGDYYYKALNEYNKWLENRDELENEMIDIAYERSLEERWDKDQ